MTTSGTSSEADPALLAHQSLNENASTSIVLIHGAFVDGGDWDCVASQLRDYHLLIPDCPGHGRSSGLPFSVERSADHIASLIERKAHGSRAHVVGHSLGAHTAIRLAEKYPDRVQSVFVSGYEVYPVIPPSLPYLLWTMNRVENAVPRPLIRWLMDGTDIHRTHSAPLSLCSQVADALGTTSWPSPWPARTLIVAAGKGGILPSYDHPKDAKRLSEIGKQGNSETVAFIHPQMRHPWNRQAPLLWAATTKAWIEGEDIPSGFVPL